MTTLNDERDRQGTTMETTERTDVSGTNSTPQNRKDSGNMLLTLKIIIVASVILGILWVLDALVVN